MEDRTRVQRFVVKEEGKPNKFFSALVTEPDPTPIAIKVLTVSEPEPQRQLRISVYAA